jgi:hypothetical protein
VKESLVSQILFILVSLNEMQIRKKRGRGPWFLNHELVSIYKKMQSLGSKKREEKATPTLQGSGLRECRRGGRRRSCNYSSIVLTEAETEDDCTKVVDEYHQLLKKRPKTVFEERDRSEDEELDQKLVIVCVKCAGWSGVEWSVYVHVWALIFK